MALSHLPLPPGKECSYKKHPHFQLVISIQLHIRLFKLDMGILISLFLNTLSFVLVLKLLGCHNTVNKSYAQE